MSRSALLAASVATGLAVALAASASAAPLPGAPGCPIFPPASPWNRPVDRLPVDPRSAELIRAIGLDAPLHPDFSAAGGYGIPINVVGRATPRQRIRAFTYASESDRVPYPIPAHPRIERGSDRHMILVDRDACRLYELFDAHRSGSGWTAGSGATWSLRSTRLRPAGWTSADAAGLPILPGLARHDEVARGVIDHALRFTAPRTARAYVFPARHQAGSAGVGLPPMGLRVRLRRSVSLRGFGPQARVILAALKRYGMILADNGSPWYVTGAPSPRWNDADLHALGRITGADFQVVDTRTLR